MANKTQNLQNQLEQAQTQLREALKRREWRGENEEILHSSAAQPSVMPLQSDHHDVDSNFDEQLIFAKRILDSRSYYSSLTNDARYKHSTSLARKFLKLFDETYNLKERIKRLISEKEELTEKISVANRTAALANHPTKYVLEKLAVKEEELLASSRTQRSMEEKIEALEVELDRSHAECADLKERMRLLLSQRSELENLKNYLLAMNDNQEDEECGVADASTVYPEDPSLLAESQESLQEPAVLVASPRKDQTPKPSTPRSPRKSDVSNTSAMQSLNLTPDAIRRMTERTPAKPGSPTKKAGFHMRTPL